MHLRAGVDCPRSPTVAPALGALQTTFCYLKAIGGKQTACVRRWTGRSDHTAARPRISKHYATYRCYGGSHPLRAPKALL